MPAHSLLVIARTVLGSGKFFSGRHRFTRLVRRPQRSWRAIGYIACLAVLGPASSISRTPDIAIVSESDLNFGRFMVFGSGWRTVATSGAVRDLSIVPLEGARTSPARFTLSYDRGNESKHVLDVDIEVVISSPPPVRINGLQGQLTDLETDLSGSGRIVFGKPIKVVLRNCRSRICSTSFQVGGTLHVDRQFGGGFLSIPIPVDATVVEVVRQK